MLCGDEGVCCGVEMRECVGKVKAGETPGNNLPSINKSKEEQPVVDTTKRIGVVKFLHVHVE